MKFTITPGAAVAGAPVDDYTIAYMAAPQDAQGNDVLPTGFPTGAPTVKAPAADVAPQADGTVQVPFSDVALDTLKPGRYVAAAQADSSAAVNASGTEQDSAFSKVAFFTVPAPPPPVPNAPVDFTVA